jgi:apolipoprotein D and lipocalin family protein
MLWRLCVTLVFSLRRGRWREIDRHVDPVLRGGRKKRMNILVKAVLGGIMSMSLLACSSTPLVPVATVANVDIPRFMGDWYVVATIPTWIERDVKNPVERYALNPDGSIATTFSYRRDGVTRSLGMTGFVEHKVSGAVWSMRPFWPVSAEYLVVYLDEGYEYTIVGRSKRDYLWVMARSAVIDEGKLQELVNVAVEMGYDRSKIVFPEHPEML